MQKYEGNDIYCDLIIPRKIDIRVVKETENILAFNHTRPFWPVHIVITPKKHIDSLLTLDLESPIAMELLKTVQEVAESVKSEHGSCRVVTNLGEYQDSKHIHIHVSKGNPIREPVRLVE